MSVFKKRYDEFIANMDDRIKFAKERIEIEERFGDHHNYVQAHRKTISHCEFQKACALETLNWRESRENLPLRGCERDCAENLARFLDSKQNELEDSTGCYSEYDLIEMIEEFLHRERGHWFMNGIEEDEDET